MSGFSATSGLGSGHIAHRWGWFVALGIVMIVAGVFALGDTVLVTLISTIFIGALLLVSGVIQIFHAFANKGWGAFLFALLCGVVYIIGGFLIMQEPVQGSVVITIVLTVALAIGGVLRIVMALRHRDMSGWWLVLLGGIISVVLAVILYASLPWSGLWVLGTLIGVELIVQGASWLSMGMGLRSIR
ncbi:MAG TPA: HdeD family acid-resistance protein [Acetobacteraceae bacterium]|jgi:uncharacterized membrane protein HdeD (DUF308 family)|nr:HdeD family acid-resistance protein [Acetobacteraceae bacterium]